MGKKTRELLVVLASLAALGACGGEGDATAKAEKAVESVTGSNDVDLKGNSPLDAIGYALVAAQSGKYSDYEVDGDTVRLIVRDGAELSGSECLIIGAASQTDYPDATFVIVGPEGETTC